MYTQRVHKAFHQRRASRRLELERFENRVVPSATLLKDIGTVLPNPDPQALTAVGDTLYFTFSNADRFQLGKKTASGFTGVEIGNGNPFPGPSPSGVAPNFTAVGSTLYFTAWDGTGVQLWSYDGTTPSEIHVGTAANPNPTNLTAVGNVLYFDAFNSLGASQLWKYDGTTLSDVSSSTYPYAQPSQLFAVGNTLYFFTYEGAVYQLGQYDGAAFKILAAGNFVSPSELTAAGGNLYFVANDLHDASRLWEYDGVTAKEIDFGTDAIPRPSNLTAIGNTLYFAAYDDKGANQLWKYDGSALTEIFVGSGTNPMPSDLTAVGGALYFAATDAAHYSQLWEYDGATLTEVVVGTASNPMPTDLTAMGGTLCFAASDAHGAQLWKYDGSSLMEVTIGSARNPNPHGLTPAGSTLYFAASDATGATQLWSSQLSSGSAQEESLAIAAASSLPSGFVQVGPRVYFSAIDGLNGSNAELWSTDGTGAGTEQISGVINPVELTAVRDTLYFTAPDDDGVSQLWKYDAATLTKITVGASSNPRPSYLTADDGVLYFKAYDDAGVSQLWKYDGAVTVILVGNPSEHFTSDLTPVGNVLYFTAFDDAFRRQLWKYDGATATEILPDASPTTDPINLTAVGDTLYFSANEFHIYQLWKYDGAILTKIVATPPDSYSFPSQLTAVGNTLYFVASDNTASRQLWKYKGSTLIEIKVGTSASPFPSELTAVGSTLYLAAYDATGANQLWRYDGAALTEIMVGTHFQPAKPTHLTGVGGTLYFVTTTMTDQYTADSQLWNNNGTSAPTQVSIDGSVNSRPTSLAAIGGSLFLSANDDSHGLEPWMVTITTALPVIDPSAANLPENATSLTITGTGFDSNAADDVVTFSGGVTGMVASATATQLIVGNLSGLIAGSSLSATVSVDGVSSGAPVQVAAVTPADPGNASINGTVFCDYNCDGVLTSGEPGLARRTVFFDLNNNGVLDAGEPSTTTLNGVYGFTNLTPGTYTVRQVLLGGVLLTAPVNGSFSLTLGSGTNFTNQNFGDVLTSVAAPVSLPPATAFPAQGNANADYVEALYRAVLTRNADPVGLGYWTGLLNTRTYTRHQVVQAIDNSPEHFGQEIDALYQSLLGRAPDPSGTAHWFQQLGQGLGTEQLAAAILNSPEFLSQGDKYMVDYLYESLLGRKFDSSGESYWLSQLGADALGNPIKTPLLTRAQVINDFLFSTEGLDRMVEGYYEVFLQRQASMQELNAGVGTFNVLYYPIPLFTTVGQGLLASDEFFNDAAANN